MRTKSNVQMIQESRRACRSIADGEFTPIAFYWFQNGFIKSDCRWILIRPSVTVSGHGCMIAN